LDIKISLVTDCWRYSSTGLWLGDSFQRVLEIVACVTRVVIGGDKAVLGRERRRLVILAD